MAKDASANPLRFLLTSLVAALATILGCLGCQVVQGFIHARSVTDQRNAWLQQLPATTKVAMESVTLSGRTIEVWTFDETARTRLHNFPGASTGLGGKVALVSPAVTQLMDTDPLARQQFRTATTLAPSGVASGDEMLVYTTAPANVVLNKPISGLAREVKATSDAVDDVPLWLGIALVCLLVALPLPGLLVGAVLIGGRMRRSRITITKNVGAVSAARSMAAGEPTLILLPGIAGATICVGGYLRDGAGSVLGVNVVADVWRVGTSEGLAVVVVMALLTALVGGVVDGSTSGRSVPGTRQTWKWAKSARRERGTPSVVAIACASVALAGSVWAPAGYLSLGLWLLALLLAVLALPGLLVAVGGSVGRWLQRRGALSALVAGGRLQHQSASWVGRWSPLAIAMVLLPSGLMGVQVLSEHDVALPTPAALYVLTAAPEGGRNLPKLEAGVGDHGGELLGARFTRTSSGWRVHANCGKVADRLRVESCRAAESELTSAAGFPMTIIPQSNRPNRSEDVLLIGTGKDLRHRLAVAHLAESVSAERVSELAPPTFRESPFMKWLLAGLSLALCSAILVVFLIVVDRSESLPDAKRLARLGARPALVGWIEATTFSVGYAVALFTGLGLGLVAIYARILVDPSATMAVGPLLVIPLELALLGAIGTLTVHYRTFRFLANGAVKS